MLLGEALLSMFPVKRAVDALMAGKKGKKDALPTLTAGGVDLSKEICLRKQVPQRCQRPWLLLF